MARHSWEDPPQEPEPSPAIRGHAWESASYQAADPGDSSDEEPDPYTNPEAAAAEFLEELATLYLESVISARVFCTLCFWATKGGMVGDTVSAYAMKPGCSTGNYQKHLDSVFGMGESKAKLYWTEIPCSKRGTSEKSKMQLPVKPVHEIVEESIDADPYMVQRVADARDAQDLPPCYDTHPVVQRSALPVIPFALYMDGLPYSLVDSVLGIWLINLLTGARQMVAMVRKKVLCQCGCRGRDTYYAIMDWLSWSLRVAASGRHPMMRHDGKPFPDTQAFRQEAAGSPLRANAAILYVKGDWAEFCERFGFPTSAHSLRPCFCCSVAPGPAMYSSTGISRSIQPWRTNTEDDFEQACRRCERTVVLNPDLHRRILTVLFYDKRPSGSHGRALARDVPEAHLLAGDRLEPSAALADPGDFELLNNFPVTITFWRPSETSLLHFRSPFWCSEIGLLPSTTPATVLPHTLYLGPMLSWCSYVCWSFLDANVFGQNAASEYESKMVSLSIMKTELFNFYVDYDASHPGSPCTRVTDLTPKMVGLGVGYRRLKTKAMETFFFLRFSLAFSLVVWKLCRMLALFCELGGLSWSLSTC